MANQEHLDILHQGQKVWNNWRETNPHIEPDLSNYGKDSITGLWVNWKGWNMRGANLHNVFFVGMDLSYADLREADLGRARLFGDLVGAKLNNAHLMNAKLNGANLNEANLSGANLNLATLTGTMFIKANMKEASLIEADLSRADLREADLSGADLMGAHLVETNLENANLTGCSIYGVSIWNVKLKGAKQADLDITKYDEQTITVDNLEFAQFIYLLLNNEKIRDVIDTICKKAVLILGRFTEERKAVLDAIRDKLRELGFVPMMFDFGKPTQQDFTETIKTLAGMSKFIIADITNPKSSPLELQATIPDYMIPFVPIIQENEQPFAMFQDLQQKYGEWVLDVLKYDSADNLLEVMDKAVIKPALQKADQLMLKKTEGIRDRHVKDYLK